RRDAALLASGERRLGGGGVPDPGDVPGDLTVGEVVEGSMNHLRRNPTQWCGPRREVAVPVVPEAQSHQRVVGLLGEERDEADRLHEPVHVTGDGLRTWHLSLISCGCDGAILGGRSPLLRT